MEDGSSRWTEEDRVPRPAQDGAVTPAPLAERARAPAPSSFSARPLAPHEWRDPVIPTPWRNLRSAGAERSRVTPHRRPRAG